jgi:hypothetical protein
MLILRILNAILVLIVVCGTIVIAALPLPCEQPILQSSEIAKAGEAPKKNCPSPIGLIGAGIHIYKDEITALSTFIIAVFTTILGLFTISLAKSTRRAAEASWRQAAAMIAIESPAIVVDEIKLVAYPDANNPASIEDPVRGQIVPDFCRALVGLINLGRGRAHLINFCLEWRIDTNLPIVPIYEPIHTQFLNTLFISNPQAKVFFGLGHPNNPVVLSAPERQRMTNGESLWIYGSFSYTNFMNEMFDLGFIARWNPGVGFEGEPNEHYAFHRKREQA